MNFSSDKLSLIYLSIAPALPNVSEEKNKKRWGKNKKRWEKKKSKRIDYKRHDPLILFYLQYNTQFSL